MLIPDIILNINFYVSDETRETTVEITKIDSLGGYTNLLKRTFAFEDEEFADRKFENRAAVLTFIEDELQSLVERRGGEDE